MAHVHDEILPAIKWGKWQSFKLLRYNRLKLLRIPPVNTLPYGGQIKSSWGKRWGSELSADLTNGIIHFNMQTLAACGQPNYGVCSLRIRTATLQRNKEKNCRTTCDDKWDQTLDQCCTKNKMVTMWLSYLATLLVTFPPKFKFPQTVILCRWWNCLCVRACACV